jgi:hypothetical protein
MWGELTAPEIKVLDSRQPLPPDMSWNVHWLLNHWGQRMVSFWHWWLYPALIFYLYTDARVVAAIPRYRRREDLPAIIEGMAALISRLEVKQYSVVTEALISAEGETLIIGAVSTDGTKAMGHLEIKYNAHLL